MARSRAPEFATKAPAGPRLVSALIIKKAFTGGGDALLALVSQEVEAVPAIPKLRPGNHEGLAGHISAGGRNPIREKPEGIRRGEGVTLDPHDPVSMPTDRERQARPRPFDFCRIDLQGCPDVRPNASDVNVQLVLSARLGRIDPEADLVP